MRLLTRLLSPALLAASFALTSCADPAPLYVDQAYVRAATSADAPAGGYFVIHGGPEDVKLRGVETEAALRIEMHQSMMKGGMMTMAPLDSVDVPAKTTVAFAPGGRHLMIFGLNPAAVSAGKLTMTMIFSNGDRLLVDAVVQKPGSSAPATPAGAAAHTEH
ncbi:MAG: copper chaperone PCu(A)C [Deltaproteobacteria bacterium]